MKRASLVFAVFMATCYSARNVSNNDTVLRILTYGLPDFESENAINIISEKR